MSTGFPNPMSVSDDYLSTRQIEIDRHDRYSRKGAGLAMGVHGLFAVFGLLIGAPQLTLLQVVSVLVYGICLLVPRNLWLQTALTYLDLLGHSTLAGWIVGADAGFQYYSWILLPLVLTNVHRSVQSKIVRALLLTVTFVAIDAWLRSTQPLVTIDPVALASLRYFNIGCYLLALGIASYAHGNTAVMLQERLRAAAGTDALTGLMNRRRISERMKEEVPRARRSGNALSLMLLDIDRFKSINDEHGHAQGDLVIAGVADVLKSSVRSIDMVSRWGGEEFLILLPDTDVQAAADLAERVRRQVATRVRRHEGSEVSVTTTIGVTTLRPLESIEAAIHRADVALYTGKRAGRDRVVVGEGDLDDRNVPQRSQRAQR